MGSVRWTKTRVAGAVSAVVLAGAVVAVTGGIGIDRSVSAQSPTPSPTTTPSPSATPAPSGSPGQQAQPSPRGGRPDKSNLAERLAQALNIPQDRVEQALQQLRDRSAGDAVQRLAPAATELGVTPQQLADAMRAARESLRQSRMNGQRPDGDAYAAEIARQLGGTITAEQVEAALQGLRDIARQNRPDRQQIEQRMQERLQELAGLLGVSPDQLRAALEEICGPRFGGPGMGGPGMRGPRGR